MTDSAPNQTGSAAAQNGAPPAMLTGWPQVAQRCGGGAWLREIDYQHAEPLALALTEAIRFDGDITVNMTALAFIDGSCARMIVDAARGLAASRTVVLRCHPGIEATFVLLGAGEMAGVSLVSG